MNPTPGNMSTLSALAATVDEPTALPTIDLAEAPSDNASPTHRYTELSPIGRGGLGEVLEAFDHDLRRVVALKRPLRSSPSSLTSLIREAQITAQLEHPNIPAIHSLGVDTTGRPFFTMTRLHGQPLSALLNARSESPEVRARLATPRLLRILLQVGYALASAHARGVIHRDIKPENIFIGDFGEVRLMDWGIARLRAVEGEDVAASLLPSLSESAQRGATRAGAFIGTPGYASPEQVEGRPELDERADVYALGALLYEMLSGRRPIEAESLAGLVEATIAGDITPLPSLVPVDERLAAIAHKALATRPEDRYASVVEMLADVEHLLEGQSVSALAEDPLKRLGRWYMSRSPRISRLRNVELDGIGWGGYALGIATGMLIATLVALDSTVFHVIAWVSLIIGVAALLPGLYTLGRKSRPDDPGVLMGYTEGATSTISRGSTFGNSADLLPTEVSDDTESALKG